MVRPPVGNLQGVYDNFVKTHKRKSPFRLDTDRFMPHTRYINKNDTWLGVSNSKEANMENITIGSQFTTQKSGVTGVVQEIVKNQNGTSRVRLSVDGQDRWTTVK